MEALMAVVLVHLIDPIRSGLAAAVVLGSRRWWIVLVSGVTVSVLLEVFLTYTQLTRTFGEALWVAIPITTLQAWVVYVVRARRSRHARP